jgi:hypothetical protein
MSTIAADTRALDRPPILVDLALQGGGSHGAYTWGVLDRLLVVLAALPAPATSALPDFMTQQG